MGGSDSPSRLGIRVVSAAAESNCQWPVAIQAGIRVVSCRTRVPGPGAPGRPGSDSPFDRLGPAGSDSASRPSQNFQEAVRRTVGLRLVTVDSRPITRLLVRVRPSRPSRVRPSVRPSILSVGHGGRDARFTVTGRSRFARAGPTGLVGPARPNLKHAAADVGLAGGAAQPRRRGLTARGPVRRRAAPQGLDGGRGAERAAGRRAGPGRRAPSALSRRRGRK
jgi:hypothetical protein